MPLPPSHLEGMMRAGSTRERREAMRRKWHILLTVALAIGVGALLWAASAPPPTARGIAEYVLPKEAAEQLRETAAPFALRGEVAPGWRFHGLRIERSVARFLLEGPSTAEVTLSHPTDSAKGGRALGETAQARVTVSARDESGREVAEKFGAHLLERLAHEESDLWRHSGAPRAAAHGGLRRARAILLTYQLAWLGLLVLTAATAWRCLRRERALLLLFIGALGVRLAFAVFGPGDLWMNLGDVFVEPGLDSRYGSSPNALLRLLFLVLPRDHEVLVWINLLLGSLAVVIALSATRRIVALAGWSRGPAEGASSEESRAHAMMAWSTALLLALHPVLVRVSGSAGRQPYVMLLALILWAAVAAALSPSSQTRARPLLSSGLAAFLCLGARPEAPLALLPAGLLALWALFGNKARRLPLAVLGTLTAALGAHLLLGALGAATAPDNLIERLSSISPATFSSALGMITVGHPRFVPLAATAFALTGLATALFCRDTQARLAATALLTGVPVMALVLAAYTPLGEGTAPHIASARYQTALYLPAALLAAAGFTQIHRQIVARCGQAAGRVVQFTALLALAITTAGPMLAVNTPRTADLEYRFIIARGRELPPGTVVWQVDVGTDVALQGLDQFMGEYLGEDRTWRMLNEKPPRADEDAVYYHGSGCAGADLKPEGRERCALMFARFGDDPLHETTLPNRPTGPERHLGQEIRVGFYRMASETSASPSRNAGVLR